MRLIQSGPRDARVMIVGEAPGRDEDMSGRPFVGPSGTELTRMLLEVGINRNDCFITNVCHVRPHNNDIDLFFRTKTESRLLGEEPVMGRYPDANIRNGLDQLAADIQSIQPSLILAFGNTPLWALTGESGIMSWRGSAMYTSGGIPVLPTIHPANILRDYANRFLAVQDLRRGAALLENPHTWKHPVRQFHLRPNFDQVIDFCATQLAAIRFGKCSIELAVDIETRRGQIACIGIANSATHAICIPIMSVEKPEGYWSAEEEIQIVLALRELLTHPDCHCTFHNGAYDLQYFAKQYGFLPSITDDTMVMQHICYPGLRKSLAVCSSLYCSYHRYWKDDGKEWTKDMNEEQLWSYNCEDCIRTFEIREVLSGVVDHLGLRDQYTFQIRDLFPQVLRTMLRGVKVDMEKRMQLDFRLEKQLAEIQEWINTAVGHPFNPGSPLQMQKLFFHDLGIPVMRSRKTGSPSLDDENLGKILIRYPLLRPLIQKINDFRSTAVFLRTFIRAPISGNRIRCTYNMTGTTTFRFSSSSDAFDYGTNLQNIPAGDE